MHGATINGRGYEFERARRGIQEGTEGKWNEKIMVVIILKIKEIFLNIVCLYIRENNYSFPSLKYKLRCQYNANLFYFLLLNVSNVCRNSLV